MRTDFSQIKSLKELTSEEWIRFRQSEPTRFSELEKELNGTAKPNTPTVLEISVNGFVQNRENVKAQRFINGILQSE